jgi:phthalate 4,5-cis-dihydrodiol dehydrogenase
MILTFNYNDFLLRPHRADEFDSERGGGIAFNQVAHQIEIVRLLGGRIRSVRASLGGVGWEPPGNRPLRGLPRV